MTAIDLPLDQSRQPQTLAQYLDDNKAELAKALPPGITPETFLRLAVTHARNKPDLMECTPRSYLACLMVAAQLGFEPGPLEQVYFISRDISVPDPDMEGRYKKEKQATFQVGYKGWLELMRRHQDVIDVEAHLVYEADEFDFSYGSGRHLTHKPHKGDDRGEILGCYGYGSLTTGSEVFDYWTRKQINDHADQYAATDKFWKSNWKQMARKTMVLAIKSWMPRSSIVERAAAVDGTTPAQIGPDSLLGEGSTGDAPIEVVGTPAASQTPPGEPWDHDPEPAPDPTAERLKALQAAKRKTKVTVSTIVEKTAELCGTEYPNLAELAKHEDHTNMVLDWLEQL